MRKVRQGDVYAGPQVLVDDVLGHTVKVRVDTPLAIHVTALARAEAAARFGEDTRLILLEGALE
jgi:hypothetical protein